MAVIDRAGMVNRGLAQAASNIQNAHRLQLQRRAQEEREKQNLVANVERAAQNAGQTVPDYLKTMTAGGDFNAASQYLMATGAMDPREKVGLFGQLKGLITGEPQGESEAEFQKRVMQARDNALRFQAGDSLGQRLRNEQERRVVQEGMATPGETAYETIPAQTREVTTQTGTKEVTQLEDPLPGRDNSGEAPFVNYNVERQAPRPVGSQTDFTPFSEEEIQNRTNAALTQLLGQDPTSKEYVLDNTAIENALPYIKPEAREEVVKRSEALREQVQQIKTLEEEIYEAENWRNLPGSTMTRNAMKRTPLQRNRLKEQLEGLRNVYERARANFDPYVKENLIQGTKETTPVMSPDRFIGQATQVDPVAEGRAEPVRREVTRTEPIMETRQVVEAPAQRVARQIPGERVYGLEALSRYRDTLDPNVQSESVLQREALAANTQGQRLDNVLQGIGIQSAQQAADMAARGELTPEQQIQLARLGLEERSLGLRGRELDIRQQELEQSLLTQGPTSPAVTQYEQALLTNPAYADNTGNRQSYMNDKETFFDAIAGMSDEQVKKKLVNDDDIRRKYLDYTKHFENIMQLPQQEFSGGIFSGLTGNRQTLPVAPGMFGTSAGIGGGTTTPNTAGQQTPEMTTGASQFLNKYGIQP